MRIPVPVADVHCEVYRFLSFGVALVCLFAACLAQPAAEPYLLVRGAFIVAGKKPDGDSVRFIPDNPALLKSLKRSSRIAPSRDGSVQLRFEGVDAPELHYENRRQPFSAEPRDALLERLGFTIVTYTKGGIVARSSVPERVRGAILSVAAEVYGRPISFVYRQRDIAGDDGTRLALSADLVQRSVNAWSLEAGLVYPLFYSSLPTDARLTLREIAAGARAKCGVVVAR